MKLPDAGFQMKKGWESLTQNRRWNKPFPASIHSSNLPQGEMADSSTGFEGETCSNLVIRIRNIPAKDNGWILQQPLRMMRVKFAAQVDCQKYIN